MNEKNCEVCNSELKLTLTTNSVHYGRLDCPKCGFRGWARNPDSDKIGTTKEYRKTSIDIDKVTKFHGFKEEFCFICLRKRNELGCSETLTKDHIIELDKGGKDEPENMQILCSACHKLKNWVRLYMNWHLKKKDENGDN